MSPESRVKSVGEAVGKSGKPYTKVEFEDGKSYPVFDKKMLEGIAPGTPVHYESGKNQRGFDNLTELRPLEGQPTGKPATEGKPEALPAPESREHAMFSMNTLNNAVALMVGFKEKIKVESAEDLAAKTTYLYRMLLELHEPGPSQPRNPTQPQR